MTKQEPQTVYVVTEGSYSDYHIIAVFGNEPDAKAFASPDCQIEPFVLGDTGGRMFRQCFVHSIFLESGEFYDGSWVGEEWRLVPHGKRGSIYFGYGLGTVPPFATGTSYVSHDHAKKLAVEGRQKWLALGSPKDKESLIKLNKDN